ncbi:retinol dehydrogenase 16-like [Discoglossus pictus]
MWLAVLLITALILLYRWYRQSQILQNLSEKYVLITGCDSGFGNLAARQLDRHGLRVLAGCLTEKGAEDLKKETSSRLHTVIIDVTDSQSVSSVAEWVTHTIGDKGLWGLVNNAGIPGNIAPIGWLKKEDFLSSLNVNLLGTIDTTLSLLPLIKKARGRIVNVASIAGRLAFVGGGYCISKYGVEAFSDNLRRELRPFGVKVSIIEPGFFTTSIMNLLVDNVRKIWDRCSVEIKDSYGQEYYNKYCKDMDNMHFKCSTNLSLVTGCMEHALTAVYPWTRYSAGWDAKLFYIPLSYMPTFMADYLMTLSDPTPCQTE